MMRTGELGFPLTSEIENQPNNTENDIINECSIRYIKFVHKEKYKNQILIDFFNDPHLGSFLGKSIQVGNTRYVFDPMSLACWFLWTWNDLGEEIAKSRLEQFWTLDTWKVSYASWATGITVNEPIVISDSIKIVPLIYFRNTREYFTFRADKFSPEDGVSFYPKAAIVEERVEQKIQDDASVYRFAIQHDIINLLNIVPNIKSRVFRDCAYAVDQPNAFFGAAGHSSHLTDIDNSGGPHQLISDEIELLKTLHNKFCSLDEKQQETFRRATRRLSQAKRRLSSPDQILELCIALEMILLQDAGHEQLSLSFRLRGSWLLGKTYEERKEIESELKSIYRLRSKVVHNGYLDGRDMKFVSKSIARYFKLAENITRAALLDSPVDWRSLVLGDHH